MSTQEQTHEQGKFYAPMNCDMDDKRQLRAQRIRGRMMDLGLDQAELAARVQVTQGTISLILTGKTKDSRHFPAIARELGVPLPWILGDDDGIIQAFDRNGKLVEIGRYGRALKKPISADLDLVQVHEIDLTFGMGATYLEIPVTTQVRHFSRDWLRQYTKADPDRLFFAQGIGNSMEPYIHDSDLLLIDTAQQSIRMSDMIWAVAYGNVGAVRRLRPKPDGSIEMLCDNPAVPNDVAHDGELHVLGRVVAIVRKT